jgi:peptidoglycan hydrolase-like protein with peptidoglycan-binding domain
VTPTPTPTPTPTAAAEPDFLPPERETEPTLRVGDNSKDGWVEYAQELLGLPQTGNFDGAMEKAVRAFQRTNGIQQDGIIGFQTWAQLRHTDAKPPSTDGRPAHSFEDAGPKARFFIQESSAGYDAGSDLFSLAIVSVGDAQIQGGTVTLRITRPGKSDTITRKIGPPSQPAPTDEGAIHFVTVENFKATFPSEPAGADVKEYFVEAYIEKALGGDFWKGKVG